MDITSPNVEDKGVKSEMNLRRCVGCYENFYNGSLDSDKRCWSFKTAKMVLKKEVHKDQVPPWKQKARWFPSCYQNQHCSYVKPDQER